MQVQFRWLVPVFVLAVAVLAAGVWRYGYVQALDQLARRGKADLALASDRLSTQLQVYRELAVLMADHPALEGLEDPARRAAAQALLLNVAEKPRRWTCCMRMPAALFRLRRAARWDRI